MAFVWAFLVKRANNSAHSSGCQLDHSLVGGTNVVEGNL